MGNSKTTNVENKKIYYVKLNFGKDEVSNDKYKWSQMNVIPSLKDNLSP